MTDKELYEDLLRKHHKMSVETGSIISELYKELRAAHRAQASTAKQAKRWKAKYKAADHELKMYVETQTAGVFE